jgi:hypothetical protein
MTSIVFDNNDGAGDAPYLQWLRAHPTGYVINTRRRLDLTDLVLHRAPCRSITRPTRLGAENPFTGKGYLKVCSDSEEGLLTWVRRRGGAGFSNRCSFCKP